MKKEIADMWIEALRSEKYQQGFGCLRRGECFCCLGVLCDISGQGEWAVSNQYNEYSYFNNLGYLPLQIQQWADIKTENCVIDTNLHRAKDSLVFLNELGYSFEQIADIIEKHWEEL